jgi:transposase
MRTIGIDLGVRGEHKAVISDEKGQFIGRVISFHSDADSLMALLAEARRDSPQEPLQAVMEPTGMAWFPVAAFLARQGVLNYLVNSQQVADLRKYYRKHAKSDRIDARVLAKLPVVNKEQLHILELPSATVLACQRGCKLLDRLVKTQTAAKNRLIALDRFAWPGLEEAQIFRDLFHPAPLWFRKHCYNPYLVKRAGVEQIRQEWRSSPEYDENAGDWPAGVVKLAEKIIALYGEEGQALDYDLLRAEASLEEELLGAAMQMHHKVRTQIVQRQYRQLHPSRNLETLPGVGQEGAAVYACFIGNPNRFSSLRKHRSWSGMIPNSRQSSTYQANGLKITQAGPRLIKKFAFLDAEVARQRDPQMAAIYFDQMVNKGKHHTQAICACATHLLDRVLTILREDRPYSLRDVNGAAVSQTQALEIIAQNYTVPASVRQRSKQHARHELRDHQAEIKAAKEERLLKHGVVLSPQTG